MRLMPQGCAHTGLSRRVTKVICWDGVCQRGRVGVPTSEEAVIFIDWTSSRREWATVGSRQQRGRLCLVVKWYFPFQSINGLEPAPRVSDQEIMMVCR